MLKAWRSIVHFVKGFQVTSAFFTGLVLLIAALMLIEEFFCFSGVMILSNGINNCCLIPGTYVLSIKETGENSRSSSFVDLAAIHTSGLQASLLNYVPNARQKLKCVHENQVTLFTTSNLARQLQNSRTLQNRPFEPFCHPTASSTSSSMSSAAGDGPHLRPWQTGSKSSIFQDAGVLQPPLTLNITKQIQTVPIQIDNEKWQVAAIKAEHIGDVVADITLRNREEPLPLFALLQDNKLTEYLLTIRQGDDITLTSLEVLLKNPPLALEEGKQGYGIPISSNAYFKIWPTAVQRPKSPIAHENTPCVHFCFTNSGRSEILALTYDPMATSYHWPIFNGRYLVRFQPLERTLSGSLQNMSWGCSHAFDQHSDLCRLTMMYFDSSGNGHELTCKINESYSTKDGYKFTMLKNFPNDPSVRIAVEYSMLRKILGMCSYWAGAKICGAGNTGIEKVTGDP